MTTSDRDAEGCRNEGCPRRAEPGEEYCAACCLETGLFHRELRWSGPDAPEPLEELAGEAVEELAAGRR